MTAPTTTITIAIAGVAYRIADGRPEYRTKGATWRPMRRRDLLALPVASEAWQWLRAHGIARPSPSGPRPPGRPGAERATRVVSLRMTPEQGEELRRRADTAGETLSGYVIERLGLDGSSTK